MRSSRKTKDWIVLEVVNRLYSVIRMKIKACRMIRQLLHLAARSKLIPEDAEPAGQVKAPSCEAIVV